MEDLPNVISCIIKSHLSIKEIFTGWICLSKTANKFLKIPPSWSTNLNLDLRKPEEYSFILYFASRYLLKHFTSVILDYKKVTFNSIQAVKKAQPPELFTKALASIIHETRLVKYVGPPLFFGLKSGFPLCSKVSLKPMHIHNNFYLIIQQFPRKPSILDLGFDKKNNGALFTTIKNANLQSLRIKDREMLCTLALAPNIRVLATHANSMKNASDLEKIKHLCLEFENKDTLDFAPKKSTLQSLTLVFKRHEHIDQIFKQCFEFWPQIRYCDLTFDGYQSRLSIPSLACLQYLRIRSNGVDPNGSTLVTLDGIYPALHSIDIGDVRSLPYEPIFISRPLDADNAKSMITRFPKLEYIHIPVETYQAYYSQSYSELLSLPTIKTIKISFCWSHYLSSIFKHDAIKLMDSISIVAPALQHLEIERLAAHAEDESKYDVMDVLFFESGNNNMQFGPCLKTITYLSYSGQTRADKLLVKSSNTGKVVELYQKSISELTLSFIDYVFNTDHLSSEQIQCCQRFYQGAGIDTRNLITMKRLENEEDLLDL